VWNEPNLAVFWAGTSAEYFHLYDVTAQAIRSVHPALRVGGPGSAAAGWVEQMLRHVDASGAPLDFLSTHVYGTVPLDFRPALERHGRSGVPIWWTEWGATPRHFDPVGDTPFAAAFLLRGMRSAAGRVDALSHWVVSDHFEELGTATELFHGGFGLLSVGNLRKPRFWALALLARLGDAELQVAITGDGAWSLVEAIAATGSDGRIGVLAWNGTLNQHHAGPAPRLCREVRLRVDTAPGISYTVAHYRVDEAHSNIVAVWNQLRGDRDWPDERQWELLSRANVLEELTPRASHRGGDGPLVVDMSLPMPGVSYLELIPVPAS
jgi:xylan 1,4-beta-xylosidase